MKGIKLLIASLAILATALTASAQNVKVSGVVTDTNGEPLAGATVMLQGSTSVGTATDFEGRYTLSVPSNGVLVASMVGYAEQTASVRGRTMVNFTLEEDSEFLDNAVVVGYGSAKKVGTLVGSVTTVKAENIKNSPAASALDKLQGQVAGLQVMNTGGVVGENSTSITLHGVGSLGASSAPLYVVDGIPSSARSIMAMNPNDILSISILKDASATSIYGSRAANGVIYVTTRGGSFDTKSTVTLRSQYGISTLADRTFLDNMMTAPELADFWIRSGLHTEEYVRKNYGEYLDKGISTNWYEVLQRMNTPQFQNDITIEGGSGKVAYMIGASQFHQDGTTYGNYYDRYTLRSNLQAVPTNWLKLGLNLNFSWDQTQRNGNWSSVSGGLTAYTSGGVSYLHLPFYPYIDEETGEDYYPKYPNNVYNQKYYFENIKDVYDRYGLTGSFYAQFEPVKNLKFVTRTGIDGGFYRNNWTRNPNYLGNVGNGYAGKSAEFFYTVTNTNTVEYNFDINHNNKVSLLAGHEYVTYSNDYFYVQTTGHKDSRLPRLQDDSNKTSRETEESLSEYKFLSFFGHFDYTLLDRYIFDGTVRYDASSRFPSAHRWAPFWSVGAKWRAKKEDFLKDVSWVNDLSLKVSYGTQGNAAIGNYASFGTISAYTNYGEASSVYMSGPENPELSWEKQKLFTIGFNTRLFNRVDFELELYNRTTTDMLMDVPFPYTSGFSSVTSNVGSLNNKGIDITLGVDIVRGKDYWARVGTTFNYNKETVTELFQGLQSWEVANTGITYVVGKPVSFYYPIFAGIDPADGAPTWYVPTGWEKYQETGDIEDIDKNTTRMDVTTRTFSDALTQNTGRRRNPPIYGGFSLGGGWKGLSVQADFSYVLGKSLINNDGYFYGNPGNFSTYNTNKACADFWTPSNTDAAWPDWSKGYVMRFDTHLLENASFMRLKSLQVSYDLPKAALNWTNGNVKGVRFSFIGRNLLTFTKYMGADPEINSNITRGHAGANKQLLGGIEITF